jgi:Zn-dependent peptidase ImmA (M78 family)
MAKAKRQITSSAAARRLLLFAGNANTVEEAVERIVSRLLDGICSPPTDLEALAKRVNVTGFLSEAIPVSGELRRGDTGFTIVYSSALSGPRRRFTIAHELGHAILEMTGRNCPRTGQDVERACDLLASEILMPSNVFAEAARGEPSTDTVLALTERFNASLSAVCIRYANLKKVAIFRAARGQIEWRTGLVRYDPIDAESSELKSVILKSATRPHGKEVIWLSTRTWVGYWSASWASLGDQRLFIVLPLYDVRKRSMIA